MFVCQIKVINSVTQVPKYQYQIHPTKNHYEKRDQKTSGEENKEYEPLLEYYESDDDETIKKNKGD